MKRKPQFIVFTLMIVLAVLVGSLVLDRTQRTAASDQPSGVSLGVTKSQEVVIRFYYDSQEQLNAVAGQLDVWEVHPLPGIGPGSGYAVAAVYPAQQDWLTVNGYRVEIDQEKTAELQAPLAALDPRYYYFDPFNNNSNNRYIVEFMQTVNAAFPNLTELLDIGDAWQATQGQYHRDMWVLRITNEDPLYGDIAAKPPFFLMGNIHAREVTTPEMAIRYIKYLTSGYNGAGGYGTDADATWLVNHHVTYVLVSQNPDGRAINEADTSAYWRKNVDNDDGCTYADSWGVDLNRNSSFKWGCCGGSDPSPCGATYRGPSRASEPETQAMQIFAQQVFQDWNGNNGDDEFPPAAPDNTMGLFISLHSYQDEILWAYECSPDCGSPPNSDQLRTIGRKLADMTSEKMNPTGFLYTVDGGTIDFIYGKLGVPSYTYEIGPTYGQCGDFFPAYGCQDGIDGMPRNFWAEMSPSWIYANKIAGSPYITSYGPDTTSLVIDPTEPVPAGTPIHLTGTVKDSRYGSDTLTPISAAEYFIDTPGVEGTGIALQPSDGQWGGTSEGVVVDVDTSGLSEGQHYVLVHGLNTDGFWGPLTAIFINITTPQYGVSLTPGSDSIQADPGTLVTYNLQLKNVGLNNDSYDISVASNWEYTAPTTTGLLAPGEQFAFDVQVTIPADANNGESDTAVVTAASQTNPEVTDTSNLTSIANFYAVAVTPPSSEGSADPGGKVSYTLQVVNNGNLTDSFDLSATSQWPVTLPVESVGPLAPGASAEIIVTVDVPLDGVPGESDTATITATSQGNASKSGSATLVTSVKTIYTFLVDAPVDHLTGYGKGDTVEYTVLITNTGNITDSYEVLVSSSKWPVDVPVSIGPVGPGKSITATITVHVPLDINIGDSNIAKLMFISVGGTSGHQVFLYTNTFWYNVYIPLSQKH
jgi:carboxypeptidase T